MASRAAGRARPPEVLSAPFALTLFALIALAAIDRDIVMLASSPREAVAPALTAQADRWPGYEAFLAEVRTHTKRGDTIAMIVPQGDDHYGLYRAAYLLAGRSVVPRVTPEARYVAIWRSPARVHGRIVWQGSGGALVEAR